jgi:hypothetical protein
MQGRLRYCPAQSSPETTHLLSRRYCHPGSGAIAANNGIILGLCRRIGGSSEPIGCQRGCRIMAAAGMLESSSRRESILVAESTTQSLFGARTHTPSSGRPAVCLKFGFVRSSRIQWIPVSAADDAAGALLELPGGEGVGPHRALTVEVTHRHPLKQKHFSKYRKYFPSSPSGTYPTLSG